MSHPAGPLGQPRTSSVPRGLRGRASAPRQSRAIDSTPRPLGPHGAGVLAHRLSGGGVRHSYSASGQLLRLGWGWRPGQPSHLGRESSHLSIGQRLGNDCEPNRESSDEVHLQPLQGVVRQPSQDGQPPLHGRRGAAVGLGGHTGTRGPGLTQRLHRRRHAWGGHGGHKTSSQGLGLGECSNRAGSRALRRGTSVSPRGSKPDVLKRSQTCAERASRKGNPPPWPLLAALAEPQLPQPAASFPRTLARKNTVYDFSMRNLTH